MDADWREREGYQGYLEELLRGALDIGMMGLAYGFSCEIPRRQILPSSLEESSEYFCHEFSMDHLLPTWPGLAWPGSSVQFHLYCALTKEQ